MPSFQFHAVSQGGQPERGTLEAETKKDALELLNARGLVPIELNEGGNPCDDPWWKRDLEIFGPSIKPRDLAAFFQTFSTMSEAKIPLKSTLEFAYKQAVSKQLRSTILNLVKDVQNGERLTASMKKHPKVFGQKYVTILEIGERANSLALAAKQCSNLIQSDQSLKSEIRAALIYPAILLLTASVVIGIVLFHLTPTLAPIFLQTGSEPPASMQMMLWARAFLINYWHLIVISIVILPLLIGITLRSHPVWLEKLLLKMPLIGRTLRDQQSFLFSNTIALMTKSGASLPEALAMAAETTKWKQYRELFNKTLACVNAGGTLSETLESSRLISPILQSLLSIGEKSDRLIPLLETASATLDKAWKDTVQMVLKLFTPALTLIIGLIVGGIIFSTMSAIMDINDVVF